MEILQRFSFNKKMVEFCDSLISAFLWLFVCSLFLFKKTKKNKAISRYTMHIHSFIHSLLRFLVSTLHIQKLINVQLHIKKKKEKKRKKKEKKRKLHVHVFRGKMGRVNYNSTCFAMKIYVLEKKQKQKIKK
jgi:large-conductance mechanosensitive channel